MGLVAFDLDGCLIDSRWVVRDAYRQAGVEAPENVLELEGIDWISDQLQASPTRWNPWLVNDIKRAKAAYYLNLVNKAKTLPPYKVARGLPPNMYALIVLSSAPVGSINRVWRRHRYTWPFVSGMDGLRTPVKIEIMRSMARDLTPQEVPVYVDDQPVDVPPPWRFVRYRGQTEKELRKEITG